MATVSTIPSKYESSDVTLKILRITNDLYVFRLPDGAIDFVVEGSENYVVQFIESKVFGSLIATLSKGNNVFPIQHDQQTELYVFTARAVDKLLLGDEVKTGPIIVPPRPGPPRFPLLKHESTSQQR
ncbi:MAG TPA: hypothetical protein VEW05_21405 [Candidatus Polarisedimenticolia bacterium]|nr:hypothetical protein [Candidatus Polarisedimenticolia bacterium]